MSKRYRTNKFSEKLQRLTLSLIGFSLGLTTIIPFIAYKSNQFDHQNCNLLKNQKHQNWSVKKTSLPNDFKQSYQIDLFPNLTIEEYKIRNSTIPNQEEIYFFGQKGMELLIHKMMDRLGFGPEIIGLQKISLVQSSNVKYALISPQKLGFFSSDTNQIVVDIQPFIDAFKPQLDNQGNINEYLDDVTELIFQIIYHEYGHYKAWTYWQSKSDYEWNNKFRLRFENLLNFKQQTPVFKNYQQMPIEYQGLDSNGEKMEKAKLMFTHPISSLYNAKSLYDAANYEVVNKNIDVKHFYENIIANFKNNKLFTLSPYLNPNVIGYESFVTRILYHYSLAELVTIKYMQLTFPFQTTHLIKPNGTWINPNTQEVNLTTYLSDTRFYQTWFDSPANQRYGFDQPFLNEETANELMKLYFDYNGQNELSNLSFITTKPPKIFSANENGERIIQQNFEESKDKINFSGWLNERQKDFNYVGYFENQQFKSWPIHKLSSKFNRLDKLGSHLRLPVKQGQHFFITNIDANEWIDGQKIANKKLYFSDDQTGKNSEPIKSSLQNLDFSIRTYQLGTNFYQIVANPESLKIVYQ